MGLIDVVLPTDQAEGTETVMGTWFKQVGDSVMENEPLLEVSTDKVTVEIAAPAAGVLQEILKQEGEEIEPGMVLGRIAAGTAAARSTPTSAPVPSAAPAVSTAVSRESASVTELSVAVRRMIEQHGLDAAAIQGTGRGGRITAQDVEQHIAAGDAPPTPASGGIPSHRVPHSAMRKRIAQHMVESTRVAPHVTSVFEADLSAVLRHKEIEAAAGRKVTLSAYFVRAAVEGIAAVPEVNSRWHDDALQIWEDVNIGVATALEESGGLIVPVIRRAQTLSLDDTARILADLTTRARAGKLETKDVQSGTFTISNHGVSGSLFAAPIIINQPQSAILGVGKLVKRMMVEEAGGKETTAIRPMLSVSLTIDHRVLDGHQANRFLTRFVEVLESWG